MYRETIDYKLIEAEESYRIQLLTGPFIDVIYQYGSVSFHEKKDQLCIAFNYNIIETPLGIIEENLESDSTFKSHISNILGSILSSEQNFKIGINGKS